jgi:hypothetical protein
MLCVKFEMKNKILWNIDLARKPPSLGTSPDHLYLNLLAGVERYSCVFVAAV